MLKKLFGIEDNTFIDLESSIPEKPVVKEKELKKETLRIVYPENYLRFPDNVFKSEVRDVGDEEYLFYQVRFNNLEELYEYLKSNPDLNRKVFHQLASESNDADFAGKPYEEAVEDLVGDVDPGYEEFLSLQRDLNNALMGDTHRYRIVRTVAGGRVNNVAYAKGDPYCYETEEKIQKPKFIRIHVSLSYYCGTTKKQVLHRAIIITNILKALEKAGYNVDLNTYELSTQYKEVIYLVVQIKRFGERLNMSALYKTLCHVEFLRRILFRVLETLDVRENWGRGYGRTASESFVRQALHLNENDIFFDQPSEMGITGKDLAKDFENAINHLNLQDKIDVEKAKKEFSEAAHTLKYKNKK